VRGSFTTNIKDVTIGNSIDSGSILSGDEMKSIVPIEVIEKKILFIGGQKMMLDSELAALYGVTTKRLNEQVRRNLKRFPPDFMYQLSREEFESLKSHFATSSSWGGRRTRPYAFTEQGIAMLSSVLNSDRAIEVNIQIMRTFVKLREMMTTHKDLARKLAEVEKKYDGQFQIVFEAIRQLIDVQEKPKRKIGYISDSKAVYRTTRKR
jgi:ORF6N domain